MEIYGVFKNLAVDMMLSQLFLVESSKGTRVRFMGVFCHGLDHVGGHVVWGAPGSWGGDCFCCRLNA